MKLSIVTVVLNDKIGFEKTSGSIISQDTCEWEWLVVDGGSEDGTLDIIEENSNYMFTIISEKDDGIYDAMNKGIKACTGDYIIFMNAGDTFADEKVVSTILKVIQDNQFTDVFLGGTRQVFDDWIAYRTPKPLTWITCGLPAFHQSTVYKSELLKQRPYNTSYTLLADYEWMAQGFCDGIDVISMDYPVSNFHVGGSSYKLLKKKSVELFKVKYEVLKMPVYKSLFSTFKRMIPSALIIFLPGLIYFLSRYFSLSKMDQIPTNLVRKVHFKFDAGLNCEN